MDIKNWKVYENLLYKIIRKYVINETYLLVTVVIIILLLLIQLSLSTCGPHKVIICEVNWSFTATYNNIMYVLD